MPGNRRARIVFSPPAAKGNVAGREMDEGLERLVGSGCPHDLPREQDLVRVEKAQRALVALVADLFENLRQYLVRPASSQ
jgi:hypothetical protein